MDGEAEVFAAQTDSLHCHIIQTAMNPIPVVYLSTTGHNPALSTLTSGPLLNWGFRRMYERDRIRSSSRGRVHDIFARSTSENSQETQELIKGSAPRFTLPPVRKKELL